MKLIKPKCLHYGDMIATVSVSHGWAGDIKYISTYELGRKRLKELYGLNVISAPNSMKGSDFLSKNPQARADDVMWAFENKSVNAIIANVGGNDSIRILPYIDASVISNNPKIFIGMSDAMNINLLCYKSGLSSFYGPNLFTIGSAEGFHHYTKKWFRKTLFDTAPIGIIEPFDINLEYKIIQGEGIAVGRLIGGHTGIMWVENENIAFSENDFKESILFIEDIPEFFTLEYLMKFLRWLGKKGFLHVLSGIIISKIDDKDDFKKHAKIINKVIGEEFSLTNLPVLYGLRFGHTSPIFILPYGAKAEINCDNKTFTILESGVI